MTRKSRELTSDEKRLWRRVAAGVKPRRPSPAAEGEDPEPEATAIASGKTLEQPASAPKVVRERVTSPPANRARERRVKRGQVNIEARLDLHGYTQDGALAALERFLKIAHDKGARTVLVITGHGRGGEGVLKRSLPDWISRAPLRAIVSGFAPAHRAHGGHGAAYVFLKRKSTTD